MSNVFFVLGGLQNGERGVRALSAGDGHQLADGHYFQTEGDDAKGPYADRDTAVEKDALYQAALDATQRLEDALRAAAIALEAAAKADVLCRTLDGFRDTGVVAAALDAVEDYL